MVIEVIGVIKVIGERTKSTLLPIANCQLPTANCPLPTYPDGAHFNSDNKIPCHAFLNHLRSSIPDYMTNRACILLLVAFSPLQGEAQETKCRPLCTYFLLAEVPVFECNITGEIIDSTVAVAEAASLFTVVNKKEGDSLIIRFAEWKGNNVLNARLCYADSQNSVHRYFLMAESDLSERIREHFDRNTTFHRGHCHHSLQAAYAGV
jgi:hypothetical protein